MSACDIHGNLGFGNRQGDIEGGFPSGCVRVNLHGDPLFVGGVDYHLLLGSPAIDAGDPLFAPGLDRDRIGRPRGAGPDIGAYER